MLTAIKRGLNTGQISPTFFADLTFRRAKSQISNHFLSRLLQNPDPLVQLEHGFFISFSSGYIAMISSPYLILLLNLGFFVVFSQSVRFDLHSGHTKCMAEDIKSNSMTVGKYHVINPNEGYPLPDSHKLTVRVTSSYGNTYHQADSVDSGQFAFTAAEAGDYMACFWAADHNPPLTMAVDFDWRTGLAAKDWSNVAKKGQIDVMELELKKLYDTVQSVHDEMYYLREREEEMQELNKTTNTRMAWLSFLSLAVCLSVAGIQIWHLKTFFERKKLL